MAEKSANNQRFIPDFLNIRYEFLFRIIGRDGKLSLELKCLFLVLILYIPGLVTTTLAGTWETYLYDWRKFVSTILIGLFVWLLIRFLKRIERKLQHVSQVISPPKKENTRTFYIIDNNTRYEYKTTALTKTVNSIPKKDSSMLE